MRFRLTAFALHVSGSAIALTLILGMFYFGWYRWPGWYLTNALHVVAILAAVDLALGPSLTAIVANPKKPRRELARDIGIIVAVQIIALGYGAVTLWLGRPLYYTFSVDRLQLVQASEVPATEASKARRANTEFAPSWYSPPRWVWAPVPDDPAEAARIVQGTLFGGTDVIDMPRYFKPWREGLAELRPHLSAVEKMRELDRGERARLVSKLTARGLDPARADAMLLSSGDRRVLVAFDPETLVMRAILSPD